MWDIDLEQKIVFIDEQDASKIDTQVYKYSDYESLTAFHMINNNNIEDRKNENEYYIMKVNFKYIYLLINFFLNK